MTFTLLIAGRAMKLREGRRAGFILYEYVYPSRKYPVEKSCAEAHMKASDIIIVESILFMTRKVNVI